MGKRKDKEPVDNFAYKFRAYPTPDQEVDLRRAMGTARYLYNRLVDTQRDRYRAYQDALREEMKPINKAHAEAVENADPKTKAKLDKAHEKTLKAVRKKHYGAFMLRAMIPIAKDEHDQRAYAHYLRMKDEPEKEWIGETLPATMANTVIGNVLTAEKRRLEILSGKIPPPPLSKRRPRKDGMPPFFASIKRKGRCQDPGLGEAGTITHKVHMDQKLPTEMVETLRPNPGQHFGYVKLPKFGDLWFRQHRQVKGKAKQYKVTRTGNAWYVSITTEKAPPWEGGHANPGTAVGIDRGVCLLGALSTGDLIQPFEANGLEEKRNHYQKRASRLYELAKKRKEKPGKNWLKLMEKAARVSSKIARKRKDYIDKQARAIASVYETIVVEDLKTQNMTKSAKGTEEEPGSNVKQKQGLNREILNQGWYYFELRLKMNAQRFGGTVLAVDPKYTSQRCSECDHVDPKNRKTQAAFICTACGHEANADVNAAINILKAGGQPATACLGQLRAAKAVSRRLMKQEPPPVRKGERAGKPANIVTLRRKDPTGHNLDLALRAQA